jgi:hypothetical protein
MSWVKIVLELNALLQCYACEISQDPNGCDSLLQVAGNIVIGLFALLVFFGSLFYGAFAVTRL